MIELKTQIHLFYLRVIFTAFAKTSKHVTTNPKMRDC